MKIVEPFYNLHAVRYSARGQKKDYDVDLDSLGCQSCYKYTEHQKNSVQPVKQLKPGKRPRTQCLHIIKYCIILGKTADQ